MANDFFSWIGDGVRSAGTFIFGENGIDFGDVVDIAKTAHNSTKNKRDSRKTNTSSLMTNAMQSPTFNSTNVGKTTGVDAPKDPNSSAIFKDTGNGDQWMMTFRRLVEGSRTI